MYGWGYAPDRLPKVYLDVARRSHNKAFKIFFMKKFKQVYGNPVATILKWHKFKEKELKDMGVYVSEEISEMFKKELAYTLEKKFSIFKDEVFCDFLDENVERFEWAMEKLEQIKGDEMDSMDDGKQTLIEDADVEVEKIYDDYVEKIRDAYVNQNVP